jgi:hypothetical protein
MGGPPEANSSKRYARRVFCYTFALGELSLLTYNRILLLLCNVSCKRYFISASICFTGYHDFRGIRIAESNLQSPFLGSKTRSPADCPLDLHL